MRPYTLFFLLGFSLHSFAQLKFSGKIEGAKASTILTVNCPHSNWLHPANDQKITTDGSGNFSITVPLNKAQVFFLKVDSSNFSLYGEPGKNLEVIIPANRKKSLQFSGNLKNENSFREQLGLSRYELLQPLNDNSAPEKVHEDLKHSQQMAMETFAKSSLSTSEAFKRITFYDIEYFAASRIWKAIWDKGIHTTSFTDAELRAAWTKALLTSHDELKLSNDSAINSYHYQQVLSYYPRLIQYRLKDKEAFQKFLSALMEKPFEEAIKEIRAKGQEFLEYKIYEQSLTGAAKESTLANFLIKCFYSGELGFIQEGFRRFNSSFPQSGYLAEMKSIMQPYFASLSADSTSRDFVFESAKTDYNSIDSIIGKHKGKVIYIDLWGTWCGPCREEFAYTKQLKERFKNKGVEFLYIAFEHQPDPEKNWKETVRYYDLKGRHLLMGPALQAYFRGVYEKSGVFSFPSYILIDKTGKLVTIYAKRPSETEKLYADIEKLL